MSRKIKTKGYKIKACAKTCGRTTFKKIKAFPFFTSANWILSLRFLWVIQASLCIFLYTTNMNQLMFHISWYIYKDVWLIEFNLHFVFYAFSFCRPSSYCRSIFLPFFRLTTVKTAGYVLCIYLHTVVFFYVVSLWTQGCVLFKKEKLQNVGFQ